jgi:hypothetical protein
MGSDRRVFSAAEQFGISQTVIGKRSILYRQNGVSMEIPAERLPAVRDGMELLPAGAGKRTMGESDGRDSEADAGKSRESGKSKLRNHRFAERKNGEFE